MRNFYVIHDRGVVWVSGATAEKALKKSPTPGGFKAVFAIVDVRVAHEIQGHCDYNGMIGIPATAGTATGVAAQ